MEQGAANRSIPHPLHHLDTRGSVLTPFLRRGRRQHGKMSPSNSTNPLLSAPRETSKVAGPPPPPTPQDQQHPTVPAPSSHLARRDMVLSLGHIHRSELPPTTVLVITGGPGDRLCTLGRSLTLLLCPGSQIAVMLVTVTRCFQPGCRETNPKPSTHTGQGFSFDMKRSGSRERNRNVTSATALMSC